MSPEQIFQNHIAALKAETLKGHPVAGEPKFKNKYELAELLHRGEVCPELFRQVAAKSLTVYQQIGLFTLLEFSSPKAKAEFKKCFMNALERLAVLTPSLN